ncbi:MAG: hypothetical protein ACRDIY_00670, partial [Chloroflexota bacterium]
GAYPAGAVGYDISFPQCGGASVPATSPGGAPIQFLDVGVNNGRPFTANPCLANEYQLAVARGNLVTWTMNIASPRGQASGFAQSGPAGHCALSDNPCLSYNYGWYVAQYADRYAKAVLQSIGVSAIPSTWWLDVEDANYWSATASLNAWAIQGAIDFFHGVGSDGATPRTIGVYSTRGHWNGIAGHDYVPRVPAWVAGAPSLRSTRDYCAPTSFTGAAVWLVQTFEGPYDADYACPT